MDETSERTSERALASGRWAPDVAQAQANECLRSAARLFLVGAVVAVLTRSFFWIFSLSLAGPPLGYGHLLVLRFFRDVVLVEPGAGLVAFLTALGCAYRLRAGSRRAVRVGRVLAWLFIVDNLWCAA